MSRTLIVNADDLGRSPGINRAIVEAHRRGIVTSATCMVNLPWSAEAARLALATPTLAVGLHLTLCYGPPVADPALVPSLLAPGTTLLDRDEARLHAGMTAADAERELRAQLARFEELFGRAPTHIDAHRHLHRWPRVHDAVVAVARERALPVRGSDAAHVDSLRAAGIRCPDRCILDFYGADGTTLPALLAILRRLPEGVSELMCHPGYVDDALADSSYNVERETELATLTAPAARALLSELEIELATYEAVSGQ